eukprot:snap_masked-scaffold_14-processed-gene-7.35-mRNA-1 protein AED:1.00 eAED:1.00 QI:0/0/0/0/1/1/2/0/67
MYLNSNLILDKFSVTQNKKIFKFSLSHYFCFLTELHNFFSFTPDEMVLYPYKLSYELLKPEKSRRQC